MLVKLIVFPKEGRTGEPKPLLKKSSNTTPKNYRPFPLMLAVFKITEKSILLISILFKSAQLEDCIKHGLLCKYQSGFRASFSTDSCLG